MKIKKGQKVKVSSSRRGTYIGIATEPFDTEEDEWYSVKLFEPSELNGISTTWFKGDKVPSRRGIDIIVPIDKEEVKVEERIGIERWGKDHWSLLGYVECRCVDNGGELEPKHLSCNKKYPFANGEKWSDEYSTRLNGYFLEDGKVDKSKMAVGKCDWDCLMDFEKEGLVELQSSLLVGQVKLTEKGIDFANELRGHKARGGSFATFPDSKECKNLILKYNKSEILKQMEA